MRDYKYMGILLAIVCLMNVAAARELRPIFTATVGETVNAANVASVDAAVIWDCFPYVGTHDTEGNIVLYDPLDKAITRVSKDGVYLGKVELGDGLSKNCRDLSHFIGVDQSDEIVLYVPWFSATMDDQKDDRMSIVRYDMRGNLISIHRIQDIPFSRKYDYTGYLQPDGNIVFTNIRVGTYLVGPEGQFIESTTAKHFDHAGNGYSFTFNSNNICTQTSVSIVPTNGDTKGRNYALDHNTDLIDKAVMAQASPDESFYTLWLGANRDSHSQVAFRVERANHRDGLGNDQFEYIVINSENAQVLEHDTIKWERPETMSPLVLFSYMDENGDIVICTQEPTRARGVQPEDPTAPESYIRIYLLQK